MDDFRVDIGEIIDVVQVPPPRPMTYEEALEYIRRMEEQERREREQRRRDPRWWMRQTWRR